MNEREIAILDSFNYHVPSVSQGERIGHVRVLFKNLVEELFQLCPESADRTAGLRQLHESMMTLNKSIVLEKK
jgi:hypothetical protein